MKIFFSFLKKGKNAKNEEEEPFIPEKSLNISFNSVQIPSATSHLNRKRLRLVSRNQHKFNIERHGIPSQVSLGDYYHSLLDLTWWKLLIGFSLFWIIMNFLFALLFYFDVQGLNTLEGEADFWTCFFFSVQTSETIGFGQISPRSFYINVIVAIEAYFSLIRTAIITGFFPYLCYLFSNYFINHIRICIC